MAPTREQGRRLSEDDLQRLVAVLDDADSVELKLTVPESEVQSSVAALGMDPLDAQIRQVFFLDTPDLALNRQGVVVRARRVQQKGDDSVVKLRPVVPSELPDRLRALPNFVVEVDVAPDGFVCSGSMKATLGKPRVREAVAGGRPLGKLFSKEQRAFYAEHAPGGVELHDLSVLGPIFVLKLKYMPQGYDRKLVAEMWLYPDNSRILELSTKCAPSEARRVAAEARAFLEERGVDLGGEQATKTSKALDFFAERLKAKPIAAGSPS